MQCPECQRELEDATQCSTCGWPGESSDDTGTDYESELDAVEAQDESVENVEDVEDNYEYSSESERTPSENIQASENTDSPLPGSRSTANLEFRKSKISGGVRIKFQKSEVRHSLFTDTYEISAAYADPLRITGDNLGPFVSGLKERRLLVIGCENADIAVDAAKVLIAQLGITDQKRRRALNVDDRFQQDDTITIQSLLPDKKDRSDTKNTAVVVIALRDSGQHFVSSLLEDPTVRDRLQENLIYLLLIVEPRYLVEQQTVHGADVPRWKISYLKYLLKTYAAANSLNYADLESRIRSQREKGWWEAEESKRCFEVKFYIDQDTLLEELQHRDENRPIDFDPEDAFWDERHIEKTVLYVATYFPGVTPGEFCELVEALLPNREVQEEVPPYSSGPTSANKEPTTSGLRPSIEIWNNFKDRFIREYLRETAAEGEITVVDFAQSSARASLRKLLDRSRRYYVKDQFNILLQKGFLFHPSTRVSEKMIRLTAENAVAYPDEFSKDWLVEIIKNLHERYHPDRNGARQRENPLFYFLDRVRFNNEGWGYSRIAELIRTLIKVPQKSDMVNRCLADLMRLKRYDAVLNIIKRLRFADEFDGLYWLKQLFDRRVDRRDAADIRPQAFGYLYYTLKEANGDIHRTLDKIDSWLPEADTNRRGYSGSAYFALRLFIKYCYETIDRFDENDVSASIEFPLFNLPTDTTVEEGNRLIDRLVRWLLHPALTGALKVSQSESWMKRLPEVADDRKRANRLIADLLAEWSVILPDRRQPPTINEHEHHATLETTVSERIREVFDQFLSRVASQLSEAQRKDLITYWDESNRRSLFSPRNTAAPKDREQAAARQKHEANRWYRVFSLGQDFRNLTSSTNLT